MNATDTVLQEIADVIRRVGKRDEVNDNIAENIDFSELIAEQLKTEGSPVRDMAIKVITTYVKDMQIEADSDEASAILEAIDFSKFVPALLQSKDFQETVGTAVESLLENGDLDLSSTISEVIEDSDLKKVLGTPAMQEVLAEKLKSYVEELDMSDMGDDFFEKIDGVVFSAERIEACLKNNGEALDDLLMKQIETRLENAEENGDDNPIFAAITESKAFNAAVERAIEDLVESGKVTRLVEKVAQDMLTGDDSELRNKLTDAISDKLVKSIASTIVNRAFEK